MRAGRDPIPVVVVGAGAMGRRIAGMLAAGGTHAPLVMARDADELALAAAAGLPAKPLSALDYRGDLAACAAGSAAVILTDSSVSPADVARIAVENGCHYLDILEDQASAASVAEVARQARAVSLAPGCGLAPGYVTGLAAEMLGQAGPRSEVTVFVGVLPQHKENRLGYANIWDIDGLMAEYTQPCVAVRDGALASLPPLAEREVVSLDGATYEAFTTAGSIDGLARGRAGRLRGLVFKTLRYPGHLDYMRFLLDDLGLSSRIYRVKSLLMTALPWTDRDRVLIAIRHRDGPDGSESWIRQSFEASPGPDGTLQSAIGSATAAHVCAVADVLIRGGVRQPGLVSAGEIGPRHLRPSPFFSFLDPERGLCIPDL